MLVDVSYKSLDAILEKNLRSEVEYNGKDTDEDGNTKVNWNMLAVDLCMQCSK